MGSSPGFGSNPSDFPKGNALFGLAFAMAPQVSLLNLATEIHSPAHSSIGTPSSLPKEGPRRLVGTQFQGLFTPLPGCFFTFPSRYCCTIGHWRCLALESGLTRFPRDSTCPVVLRIAGQIELALSLTRLSLSSAALSRVLLLEQAFVTIRRLYGSASLRPTTPTGHWSVYRYLPGRFGLFPVRSPLLRE